MASLTILLTGCENDGGVRLTAESVKTHKVPQDIVKCLEKMYGPPPAGMNERETALYIAGFNRHDLAKTQCGRRALAWGEGKR